MVFPQQEYEVPRWVAVVLLSLIGASVFYGIVVMQSLVAPIILWLTILSVGLSLFVVYLLYRFVVAVETIAEKL